MKTTITQNQIFRTLSRLQRSCCSAVFLLLFLLSVSSSWGQGTETFTTATTTGSWTCPAGVTSITIECWGAGGYGGTTNSGTETGGGGGGAYAKKNTLTVTPGISYSFQVGSGTSGTASSKDSWFSSVSTVLAKGGTNVGNSGTGGTGGASASSVGDTKYSGGNGSSGSNGNYGGGGGSSAGTGSNGNNASSTATGASSVTGGGAGGNGAASNGAGSAGSNPGGGGGGCRASGSNSNNGGAGGTGKIVITYTCPADAGTLSGTQSVCMGSTTTFSSNVLGGAWSSGTTAVATINSATGVITPVSAGTATITYTVTGTGGCTTKTATRTVTVTAAPSAGTLSGIQTICLNGTTTLSSTVSGGTWSSQSTGVATIDGPSGVVTPVSVGTSTMTYSVTSNGCTGTATMSITVKNAPTGVTASDSNSTICVGASVDLISSAASNNSSVLLSNIGFEFSDSWTYTNISGSTKTGTSGTGDRPASTSFVNSDSTSFWINNGTATVTTDNIPGLSGYTNKYFQFDLAAFSIGSTSNGVDGTDLVTVSVSIDGGSTYSNEITVAGNTNAYWGFATGAGVAEVTYDGNNTATAFAPSGTGNRTTDGYGLVKVNLPNSATQVKVRITLLNNDAREAWVIDDLTVEGTPNATYAWTSSPAGYTSAAQNPTGVAPTETTTYTVTATNAYGCSTSANTTVTVNPLPTATISAGSAPTTFCAGGSVVLSANTGSGLSYQWKLNGTNITGATDSSYTAEASGSYTVTVTNSNNCSATSDATTVTVNTLPNQATATSTNSCGTATLVADGGSASVAWYSDALGTTPVVTSGNITVSSTATTSTLTIVDPTATTTYYAYTFENGCRSQNNREAAVELKYTNTYTGTGSDWFTSANWSCGIPTANSNVVIPTGKTVSIAYLTNQGPAYAYSVTLQGNASLTITTDHDMTVVNKVTVPSTASFTVQNNASLVQTDNVTNEGVITVQKSTPSARLLKRYDAVLWSSPVVQNLRAISTGTPDAYFMQHNPQANSWSAVSSPATADFTKGKGFLVRTPSTFPTTATQQWNVNFVGVPNNGNVTISAGDTGNTEKYLLVGNPYPSAISIAAFRAANPNITGVFYFFRKPNGVAGISSYGTLSVNGSFAPNDNALGAIAPGDVIASGQGFFVAMKSDNNNGNVYFTNAMRVANDHGHFNRVNTNLDTYKLTVQTPAGGNSQFITNYDSETTNGYDVGYDAVAFTDGTTDLSIIMNNEKYRIQSRGDYNSADVIPVQFKTGVAGEHRIKLQDAQGVFAADQMVIIKDNLTGVQHNLTANGDYVFTSATGTFTNRFEVIYQQAYYTALQANSCGATIANMSSLVYADIVNGATGYRFKVVNNTTSAVQTIDRPQHWFAFNMLSAYDYNTPYTISVQVQKDGVWTGYYGATCTVNSPNIATTGVMQINPSQCGMTLPTLGTVIATTPVAGATGYKFRITNTTAGAIGNNLVQEITRTNHWFSLGMLSRYNYGSSYAIEVAVKTTGGYTPYGNACTVYSPAVPTLATCGQTVATATTLVRTTAMTLATQYRFQVTRMSTQETITFDTANYWFSFRVNVPGYAAGEQYGVRVAVMTAGAWSPYGDACDITAPIATARTTEEAAPSEANLFKPVAYPNPFANTFGISLATPSADVIHVMVYDLQGRLIEKQNVFVSQLDGLQIGTNYPSGDYLLVVAQGANIKSSHIHKD